MSFLGNTPSNISPTVARTDFTFIAAANQTIFSGVDSNGLTLNFDAHNFDVYANGVLLDKSDYSGNGTSFTLIHARNAGDVITLRAYGIISSLDNTLANTAMQPSVYDPNGIKSDVFNANNIKYTSSVSTVPRPVINRLNDSISVLDAMASGGLDSAIRNREVTTSDATEITSKFAEVTETCATNGWKMIIPGGDYFLNAAISTDSPLSAEGDGATETNLRWIANSVTAGFNIKSGTSQRETTIDRIGFYTAASGIGTGLSIDHGDSFTTSLNRSTERVSLNHIITGQEGTGYWGVGVNLINCVLSSILRHTHKGYLTDSAADESSWTGVALQITGDTSHQPAQVFASHLNYTAVHDALKSTECEGIYLNQFEFPTCWNGATVVNDTVNTGNAAFNLFGGHINARSAAIDLTNVNGYKFASLYFYLRNTPTVDTSMIKIGSGCTKGIIRDNTFYYSTTAAVVTAIDVQGGSYLDIENNEFDVGSNGRGVNISSNASFTDIGKNTWISAANRVVDSGNNTTFYERFGYSSSLNNISLSSRRGFQIHHLVTGATDGPGNVSANGSLVETYSSDATTGFQLFRQATGNGIWRRSCASSVWSTWARQDGAGNVDASITTANTTTTETITVGSNSQLIRRQLTGDATYTITMSANNASVGDTVRLWLSFSSAVTANGTFIVKDNASANLVTMTGSSTSKQYTVDLFWTGTLWRSSLAVQSLA